MFHHTDEVLKNYWIVIDVIVVFLSQTYISAGLYMKVDGEVVKNLFSLHFLQKQYQDEKWKKAQKDKEEAEEKAQKEAAELEARILEKIDEAPELLPDHDE